MISNKAEFQLFKEVLPLVQSRVYIVLEISPILCVHAAHIRLYTLDDIDDEDFDLGQGYGHDSSPVIKVGASHIKYVYILSSTS